MTTSSRKALLCALAVCLGLAVGQIAWANGDNEPGGDIQGTEQLDQRAVLAPTVDAPPGASGTADLSVNDENGTTTSALDLQIVGLPPGTYTATVTLKSTGASILLGSFTPGTNTDSGESSTDTGESNITTDDGESSTNDENTVDVSFDNQNGLPLPAGLNPMDIASVLIADSTGVVLLTGDFMTPSPGDSGELDAEVTVEPGAGDPGVTGTATVQALIKHGKMKSKFSLTAQGLPAKSSFAVKVNGAAAGSVRSNARGLVKLKRLPKATNPLALTSLELYDGQGHLAAKARF